MGPGAGPTSLSMMPFGHVQIGPRAWRTAGGRLSRPAGGSPDSPQVSFPQVQAPQALRPGIRDPRGWTTTPRH